jgi:hypothetical protein
LERALPCPSCLEKKCHRFLTQLDEFIPLFGKKLGNENELECPTCHARWVIERADGWRMTHIYLSSGRPVSVEGTWAFSESAPRGEGDHHAALLTLSLKGTTLTGTLAEWSYNDWDQENTRSGRISRVNGEWRGEYAHLLIEGGETGLESGGTPEFFVKPYSCFNDYDAERKPEEKLIVTRYEEYIRRNQPFRTWRRAAQYDTRPSWLEGPK